MHIYPSKVEFKRLAKQGNVIPVYGEVFDDLETPVSAFLKIDDGRHGYLLESLEGGEKVARYSFLGSHPRLIFMSKDTTVTLTHLQGRARVEQYTARDPLKEIAALMQRFKAVTVPGLPRFCGGLVGTIGYDAVRFIEKLPAHAADDLQTPDIMLMLADTMVVFDHLRHRLLLVANAFTEGRAADQAYREAVAAIHALAKRLRGPLSSPAAAGVKAKRRPKQPVTSNVTPQAFSAMVKRAKQYIRAGDIFQVVLSQRLERTVQARPFDVYRALRSVNPSPYMFFIRFGELALLGASPEMLVRCEEGHLETRPIAGTRPRGKDEREDQRMVQQLLASPKERAEHIMLVDLGRNDLGRVGKAGSVEVPELMVVEKYSHVLHLVSSVTARLKPGYDTYDVLRAAFPAGTVSGAPKIRAMEIIAELERSRRGPYAGAVGYFSFSGNLDSCITIRTILMRGNRASVQAGAGIVADSQPEREYEETLNKARGMLKALEVAEERFA
jgi:anthranilate synthase component 1